MCELNGTAQVTEQFRSDCRRGSVCAINDDLPALEAEPGYGRIQKPLIVLAEGRILGGRRQNRRIGRRDLFQLSEDLILDANFNFVREFVSIAAEDLDAFV